MSELIIQPNRWHTITLQEMDQIVVYLRVVVFVQTTTHIVKLERLHVVVD